MIDYMLQLETRGVEITQTGVNYAMMCCPFHGESEPSLSLSLTTGRYNCFSCHEKGDFANLIAQIDEIDLLTAYGRVKNMINPTGVVKLLEKQFFEDELEQKKNVRFIKWSYFKQKYASALEYDDARGYLYKRGITEQSIRDYRIRFCDADTAYYNRVIIPIFQERKLVSWVGRLIYDSPTRSKTRKTGTPYYTLFGIPQLGLKLGERLDYLILVEGEFDAIYLRQFGLNVVAVMGSGELNKYRLSLLRKLTNRVVLAFDGDQAGRDGMYKNYQKIRKVLPVERCVLPWGKDPNTLNTAEVNNNFSKYLVA
jgi:DNA primase